MSAFTIPHRTPGANDPFAWAEIQRITSLPVVTPMADPIVIEEFNRLHILADQFNKGFRLTPEQAEGISAYELYGSVFGKLPVGTGKTALCLMCANAGFKKGFTRILQLVPSQVYGQLVDTDIAWARKRVDISFPIHVIGGKSIGYRKDLCRSGRKGMYLMPHSYLSTKDTSDNLAAIDPQLIIVDEAHRLANPSSACTRRFVAMLKHLHNKGTPAELVLVSGTITNKSIKDYYHLIKWCLKERCPLPQSESMANDWAVLIDAQATSENGAGISPLGSAPIIPLVKWAKDRFPDEAGGWPSNVFGFRKAFKLRLSTAPGVVSSSGAGIGTTLLIQNRPAVNYEQHKGWKALKRLIDLVEDEWTTPNGDAIDHAIHKWKWLSELSCGFYNELVWPTAPDYAKRKKIDQSAATDILKRAVVHHQANQEYTKVLRKWLENHSRAGCDTPFLVGQNMVREGAKVVGQEVYGLWREWKDLDFEGRPDRDSHAVRVCDYKVQHITNHAVEHVKENPGKGIIYFYHHHEVGDWLTERMVAEGLDVVHAIAGEASNRQILDMLNKGKVIVASIKAHGTGKNLQHFEFMHVVQWPRPAKDAEQLIGRLHRQGQEADELPVTTCNTLMFDHMNMAACLNDALYIHQSTGDKQKLIYANYDPLPKIFPPAVLYQRGLEVDKLTAEQEALLREKFGGYA